MNSTRIFVSSTCYDLSAVRESIREMILDLGHTPLLSEYPSFPVSPDANAIANCRRNVREHSDVLVLIVGGRRGSLDPDTGKPVTNLEYDEARHCGLPVYVFVSRTVNDLLHVWKQNPSANFAPSVDYPAVFTFVEQIRAAGVWTFPFDRTSDIKEVLRGQFSGLLKELLDRRKAGRLDPLLEFVGESKRAQQLALEKPRFWEHLLTAELLASKLASVRTAYDDVVAGLVHTRVRKFNNQQVFAWVQERFRDMEELVVRFDPAFKVMMASWGPPGQPGNAVAIQKATSRVAILANEIVEWEKDVRSIMPTEIMTPLVMALRGCTTGFLGKLEMLPQRINKIFEDNPEPEGTFELEVLLEPLALDKFKEEMQKLKQAPWLLVE